MKTIYSYFNLFLSLIFLSLFVLFLRDSILHFSVLNVVVTVIFFLLSLISPGHYITYNDKFYIFHLLFYQCKINFDEISIISAQVLGNSFLCSYVIWSDKKSLSIFLPFCTKQIDDFFCTVKKINPNCRFV